MCRHEAWRNGNGRAGNHSGAARTSHPRSLSTRASSTPRTFSTVDAHREGWRTRLDFEDEVIAGTVLTHAGEIRNEAARSAVEGKVSSDTETAK